MNDTPKARIGVTGLAVMGRNLARNLARHGNPVALHNRTYARTQSLVDEHGEEGTFVTSESMRDFVASIERFLPKPFTPRELGEKISKVLARQT